MDEGRARGTRPRERCEELDVGPIVSHLRLAPALTRCVHGRGLLLMKPLVSGGGQQETDEGRVKKGGREVIERLVKDETDMQCSQFERRNSCIAVPRTRSRQREL